MPQVNFATLAVDLKIFHVDKAYVVFSQPSSGWLFCLPYLSSSRSAIPLKARHPINDPFNGCSASPACPSFSPELALQLNKLISSLCRSLRDKTLPEPLNSIHRSLFEQLPGCWGCKDTESVFVYANLAYNQLIGLMPGKLYWLNRFRYAEPNAECAQDFRAQDKHVMDTRCTLKDPRYSSLSRRALARTYLYQDPWLDDNDNVRHYLLWSKLTDTAI